MTETGQGKYRLNNFSETCIYPATGSKSGQKKCPSVFTKDCPFFNWRVNNGFPKVVDPDNSQKGGSGAINCLGGTWPGIFPPPTTSAPDPTNTNVSQLKIGWLQPLLEYLEWI